MKEFYILHVLSEAVGKTCWEERAHTKQPNSCVRLHTGFLSLGLLTLWVRQLFVGEGLPCAKGDWQQMTTSPVMKTKNVCRCGQMSSGVLGANSPRLRTTELYVVLVHSPSSICNSPYILHTHTHTTCTVGQHSQLPSKEALFLCVLPPNVPWDFLMSSVVNHYISSV